MLRTNRPIKRPSRRSALLLASLPVLAAMSVLAPPASAAVVTWIGGNVDWVDNSGNTNWSPNDEPDVDDDVIFNTANTVSMGSNNSVLTLDLSGSIDLRTNGFDLTVNGLVELNGAGSTLIVGGAGSLLAPDNVTINSGATLELEGGAVTFVEETLSGVFTINAGGTLVGNGTVLSNDGLAAVTTVYNNSGTISARSDSTLLNPPPVGTLTINAANTNARIDLDGSGENGIVNVFRNQTLDVNVTLADAFSGDINVFHNSSLDISTPWTFGAATMDVDNGFVDGVLPFPDVPADVSFIKGGAMTQTGGTITVIDLDGTLQFDAPFTMNGGNLVNNGLVIFNENATIGAGANFTMPTNDSSLTVNAGVTVTVNQANFNPDGNGLLSNTITIHSGGTLDINFGAGSDEDFQGTINLHGGTLNVSTTDDNWNILGVVNAVANTGTSTLTGETLNFNSTVTTVGANSILSVNSPANLGPVSTYTGAGTFRLNGTSVVSANTTISTAIFDWDGTGIGTLHTINDGVVFTIDSNTLDNDGDMDDPLTINGGTLAFNGPASWEMRNTLTTNAGAVGTPTIGGTSRMVLNTSAADFSVNGNTTVNAPITFGAASTTTITAPATLTVNSSAIYDGGTITGSGTFVPASGIVESSSSITVTNFDFDRGSWHIHPGATLTVNVSDYDPGLALKSFDAAITVNSGTISVNSADAEFVMNGTLNLSNTTGSPATWNGEPIDIGDDASSAARLNVGGTGVSVINPSVDFNSDAAVTVSGGATLVLTGLTTFSSNNGLANATFTGTGTFVLEGTGQFIEATTINMLGGVVDLDGRDADVLGATVSVLAPTVINAATVASFGKVNTAGTNILTINNDTSTGSLTVNLDSPAASWTINGPGVLNLVNDLSSSTLLAGSPIIMDGTMNVTGEVRSAARLDIGGIININTAGAAFRLGAGLQTVTGANRLSGGTIQGVGILGSDSGRALFGFGTINTAIDFDGTASLRADDGTLTINGAILDLNQLGTLDTDGILNIPAAWNTTVAGQVILGGGEVRGGMITNDNINGIAGHGLVSSRVVNNTLLNATSPAGALIFETVIDNNDWDGAANTGELRASTGNLTVRDGSSFPFLGTVTVNSSRTFFTDGFELEFEPGSTLNLTGGAYRQSANIVTNLGGTINVNAGPESSLSSDPGGGLFQFDGTSNTTLAGTLLLDSNVTVQAGATFAGAGTLRNQATKTLSPDAGSDINVLVDNRGLFAPAGTGLGRVDVKDYQQAATGRFVAQIGGPGLNQFDRLVVNGIAQLAGSLDVDLAGGFIPTLGQTFNIINATGGVSGTFPTVTQPDPVGVLGVRYIFTPSYQPTLVSVSVTRAFYEVQSGSYPQNYPGAFELIKTTPATATLSGNNTYTGLTTVSAGTLVFANLNSLGEGGLDIQANATAQFAPGFSGAARLTSLAIAGAPDAWTGKLDVTNNDMVVRSAPGTRLTDLVRINNQVKSGLNEAGGSFWTGNGINSSTAAANAGGILTAVGVILNDFAQAGLPAGSIYPVFGGVPVNENDILAKYTWFGDADLSGVVDGTDYFLIDQAFTAGTLNGGWLNGDFNYSGNVDGTDYFLIDQAFNAQTGPLSTPAASVPEPGVMFVTFAGLLGLARRRRI